eukprot:TRINITY_DN7496_c0_g1_i1.p1 TRINITY_DN7496_c0_g1~~TRINITY_DN7496_c0_g1_i1.p1  ORF type:complete len:143 (+),score=49.24 TRINITY_DN7496_c0_g1_i1:126-554(+)
MCSMGDKERKEGDEVARMLKERQSNLVSEMMKMTVSSCPTVSMDTCDLLTMADGVSDTSEQQDMEVAANPAYAQYMMKRSLMKDNYCHPDTPGVRTSEPVYLPSLASQWGVGTSEMNTPLTRGSSSSNSYELKSISQQTTST